MPLESLTREQAPATVETIENHIDRLQSINDEAEQYIQRIETGDSAGTIETVRKNSLDKLRRLRNAALTALVVGTASAPALAEDSAPIPAEESPTVTAPAEATPSAEDILKSNPKIAKITERVQRVLNAENPSDVALAIGETATDVVTSKLQDGSSKLGALAQLPTLADESVSGEKKAETLLGLAHFLPGNYGKIASLASNAFDIKKDVENKSAEAEKKGDKDFSPVKEVAKTIAMLVLDAHTLGLGSTAISLLKNLPQTSGEQPANLYPEQMP